MLLYTKYNFALTEPRTTAGSWRNRAASDLGTTIAEVTGSITAALAADRNSLLGSLDRGKVSA
jgi:hypothetical protein